MAGSRGEAGAKQGEGQGEGQGEAGAKGRALTVRTMRKKRA